MPAITLWEHAPARCVLFVDDIALNLQLFEGTALVRERRQESAEAAIALADLWKSGRVGYTAGPVGVAAKSARVPRPAAELSKDNRDPQGDRAAARGPVKVQRCPMQAARGIVFSW